MRVWKEGNLVSPHTTTEEYKLKAFKHLLNELSGPVDECGWKFPLTAKTFRRECCSEQHFGRPRFCQRVLPIVVYPE